MLIYTRTKRASLLKTLSKLPERVSNTVQKAILVRVGLAALARIRDAFVIKSHGGTDDTGLRWKPLSPYTIAARRHPGLKRRKGLRPSAILSSKQRKRWWKLYSKFLAIYRGDKGHAAAVAWVILKQEGAKTIIGTYGNMNVDILRDTGLLLNSLSPGISANSSSTEIPRVKKQVFRLAKGEVIVGTNRKWAGCHHRGVPGKIPQRRLWPEPSKWTNGWWKDILEQARQGLIDVTLNMVKK